MRKPSKSKSLLVTPQDEPNVIELINKVQQQLSAVEKKLDILISQSSKEPFQKSYSQKPSQSFGRPHRYDRARPGSVSKERIFTRAICSDCNKECEIPFKPSTDRPVYCRECFPKHKKSDSFNSDRDNRPEKRDFSRKSHSDKRQTEKRQKPAKQKPFYARVKKRA